MNHWDSVGRWINTLLLFIVGVIAFDTLFRMLEAQESNVIVGAVRVLSTIVLVPFYGMFSENDYIRTALVGILGYAVLVGIALSVLRGIHATTTRPYPPSAGERQHPPARSGRPATAPPRSTSATAASDASPQRTALGRIGSRRNSGPGRGTAARSAPAPPPPAAAPTPTDSTNPNGAAGADGGASPRTRPDGAVPSRAKPADADGVAPSRAKPADADGAVPSRAKAADAAAGRPGSAAAIRPRPPATDKAASRSADPARPDGSD